MMKKVDPLTLRDLLDWYVANRTSKLFTDTYRSELEEWPIYFFDELVTVPVDTSPGHARVTKCWRVWVRDLDCIIFVEAGFEFDWDSVPRWPVVYLLYKGRIKEEAALHDWLYRYQTACGNPVTWWQAEKALADAMVIMGRHWFWRLGINTGTTIGGWIPWLRYKNSLRA